jgi:hypothetical protein
VKSYLAGLTNSVVTTYDQTKTTLFGRVFSKTVNSQTVLGPPLTNFIDVITDTIGGGAVTANMCHLTQNGRLFIINTPAGGVATVLLYQFDLTGVTKPSYVGRIVVNLPNTAATVHANKMFKVYDGTSSATVTGWKIGIGTTASILINGGVFVVNNVALSDFVPTSPPTFGMAIATNAKSVYMVQDPANIGVNNNLTTISGGIVLPSTGQLYPENGLAGAANWMKIDLTVSPVVNNTYSTITAQTTLYAGTSPSAFFKLPAVTVSGFNALDPVVLTGSTPTPFVASTATFQTGYFMRDIQVIGSDTYFNLSTVAGGAATTPTSAIASGLSIMRAFGQTTTPWTSIKTGNIAGIGGVIVLSNAMKHMNSADTNLPAALQNQDCCFFTTSNGLYSFKISDITNGAVSFPSMSSVNTSGSGIDYTAVIPAFSTYSNECMQAIYVSNTSTFYAKNWMNSVIKQNFGGLATIWFETINPVTTTIDAASLTQIDSRGGWVLAVSTTTGQRGIFYLDLQSDDSYGYSYLTSPVLSTKNETLKYINTIEQLFDVTDSFNFYYKTAALSTDATFASPTTGWTAIATAKDLSIALQNYTQFKVGYQIATLLANTPPQITDIVRTSKFVTEISDNWEGSVDNTTANGNTPARTAFRLQTTYASVVPTMYFRAYDDSGNLVISANTVTNAALFQYSTDNGTSWNALGTIPNVALTTEIRYNWASPPGVRVTTSLSES